MKLGMVLLLGMVVLAGSAEVGTVAALYADVLGRLAAVALMIGAA